jgi:hypothetical protein
VRRPLGALQDSISAARQQLSAFIGQCERTVLLGTVLLASAISAVTGFVLTQSAYEWASVLSGEPTNNTLYFWGWPHRVPPVPIPQDDPAAA